MIPAHARRSALFLSLPLFVAGAAQEEPKPDFWRIVERSIEKHGVEEPATQVLDHMAGLLTSRGPIAGRLTRVERALTEPWTPPELARELRDVLAAPVTEREDARFAALWGSAAELLDLELPAPEEAEDLAALDAQLEALFDSELTELELLTALSAFVGEAHRILEGALEGLEDDHLLQLFETPAAFREAWYRGHFPDQGVTQEQTLLQGRWIQLLQRGDHDLALALAVTARLARLGDKDFRGLFLRRLRKVKTRAKVDGLEGDVRAVVGEAPCERVVLGGTRTTRYALPAALIIDLGGDDHYQRAAVVDDLGALASVVVDLNGDDHYEGESGPALATGGVAILVDAKGDDVYRSKRLGQGAATLGVALLVDQEGNDEYVMEDYGQGHALGGAALVYDLEGDDRYEAWAYAQGGGLAGGLSALVDGEGDDSYLADLHWPDVYGNSGPEIYHGASQGYCTGIRTNGGLAGGVAALVDLGDGKDRYQSGNFSQGGAYYFSFGLMYDGGGDDENFGTRYSQGFGVHQAAAVRWDAGGNDQYTCRSVAHTGMAWDEGVGYLLEDGGDDVYKVGALALGGAAQTGVAICIDLDGKDDYGSGGQAQGGTGGSDYHNKPSLGVLIDLGGDRDRYSGKGREDGAHLATEGVGIFLDSKAGSMEKALKALR